VVGHKVEAGAEHLVRAGAAATMAEGAGAGEKVESSTGGNFSAVKRGALKQLLEA
jgi:hypothetical protein